jgi:hypothetical protein
MKYVVFLVWYFFPQEIKIPYKASDEFELNVDIKFKNRPANFKSNSYAATGERLDKGDLGPQPFVSVTITNIKILSDEFRVLVVDSNGKTILKKDVASISSLSFEMGFVDDLQNKVTPYENTVYFLSKDKSKLRRIVFTVQDDGTFMVNGNWRGKF